MEVFVIDEDFTVLAKNLVRNAIVDAYEQNDREAPKFNVKIVWACKTLQNWKAFVITDLPDQLMYEVTHNGDKKETYIDTYQKAAQDVIRDGD